MYRLSQSSLGTFQNCPKCFWMEKNKSNPRPFGIKSSLPTAIDGLLKTMFDTHRPNLPPALEGKLEGHLLEDKKTIQKLRNWRSCYTVSIGENLLIGAFDDVLVTREGHESLDYKSKGTAPDEGYTEKYYQKQADLLTLMLKENGVPVSGYATFAYFYAVPTEGSITFDTKIVRIKADIEAGKELFKKAVRCLNGPEPQSSTQCEYCLFIENRGKVAA